MFLAILTLNFLRSAFKNYGTLKEKKAKEEKKNMGQ